MSKPMIQIQLFQYGLRGWRWIETYQDWDGIEVPRECRTNQSGGGLFVWSEYQAAYLQELGTCQFSLPSKRKNAYNQIRYYVKRRILQL